MWLIFVLLLLAGCRPKTPTPTPTAFPLPTPTNTERAATATPSPLPTDTPQPTATPSPLPTDTPHPTATPSPWPTDTPLPTATPSPLPTLTTEQQALAFARQVSTARLMTDVYWLADDARRGRLSGSPEEDEVGAWLVQWFQHLGLQPFTEAGLDSYYLQFQVPAITRYGQACPEKACPAENVIAVLPGTTWPDRYVGISAHYDHIGVLPDGQVNNGADDDASGVAAMLEAARIFSTASLRPQETLVFVGFSGEEVGLLGSLALCNQLAANGLTSLITLLNMELLGAVQGKGTYLDVWDQGVAITEPLVQAVQRVADGLGVRVERQGRDPGSDAVRLVLCGVPAITVDVAWSLENHPHYHRPSDDPEHIDVEGFGNAVRVAVATIWLLANDGR